MWCQLGGPQASSEQQSQQSHQTLPDRAGAAQKGWTRTTSEGCTVLLTPHGNTSLPRPSPGLLVVFAAGPEDGFSLCSLSIFSAGLIVSLCNLPVCRHNKPPLHQTCFQALYHIHGFLGLQLHLAPNPPQQPDAAQDHAEQRSSLLPYSRVCVDFLSSVSFLLPSSHCPAGILSPTLLLLQIAAPPVGQEAGIALGVLRGALGHCSPCPSGLKAQTACRKVQLSPCGTCPGFELSSVWGRGTGGTRGTAPTSLQQQGTGLGRAAPFADEVLVELLEANGLEDAVLVILAGEQGNRQGLGPSPSGRGDLSPPGTAEIPACRPALVWRRSGKTKCRAKPQQGAAVWPALG